MSAAPDPIKLKIRRIRLADLSSNVASAAHGVAFSYGRLSIEEHAALPEHFRNQLDDLALRLAAYHSVRDGDETPEERGE